MVSDSNAPAPLKNFKSDPESMFLPNDDLFTDDLKNRMLPPDLQDPSNNVTSWTDVTNSCIKWWKKQSQANNKVKSSHYTTFRAVFGNTMANPYDTNTIVFGRRKNIKWDTI